jgi:hypothetical protein
LIVTGAVPTDILHSLQDDPIYGSYEQDKEERRMTELVTTFLEEVPNSSVRCILHIAAGPLANEYQVSHIRRRLEQLRQMVVRYPKSSACFKCHPVVLGF